MPKSFVSGFIFGAGLTVLLFGFQNCGQPLKSATSASAIANGTKDYIEMSAANAEAMAQPYELECQYSTMGGFTTVPADSDISGTASLLAMITSVSHLTGAGNLVLVGDGVQGYIQQANLFTGNLTLCGADLEILNGSAANVVTVDGYIGEVKDSTGNVIILNGGYPQTVENFGGNIVVRDSSGRYSGRTYVGSGPGFNKTATHQ
jgi:hypothetical protein